MRWFIVLLALTAGLGAAAAQPRPDAPPAEKPDQPEKQPKAQPDEPAPPEKPSAQEKTLKVFFKITDYINDSALKMRVTQFILKEALRVGMICERENFIKRRVKAYRKSSSLRRLGPEKLQERAEHEWFKQRVRWGLAKIDLSHIKILKVHAVKRDKPDNGEELVPGGEEKKPQKKGLTEKEAREQADVIVEGQVRCKKEPPSIFLKQIVTFNASAEGVVKVIDAKTKKVLKELRARHKMGAAKHKGQGKAYESAVRAVGFDLAKQLLKVEAFLKDAKECPEELLPPKEITKPAPKPEPEPEPNPAPPKPGPFPEPLPQPPGDKPGPDRPS